nr:PREDICTED: uncharacterized protein LOC109043018 isoform X2 [Bemisia tabaci]
MECTQVIPDLHLTQDISQVLNEEHVARILIAKTAQCEGAEYFLKNGQNVIGRCSLSADVCIQDVTISRKHAVIICHGKKSFHVYDAGSANGTFLESRGSKCKLVPQVRYNLCCGDTLTFGTIVATFTKDLKDPVVIEDSDSDTGSESMLPLDGDDDPDDSISGPVNQNKKRMMILSDTEEDEKSNSSRDSSSEIQSSQPEKPADKEVSPFKTPTAPPIRSSQFRFSQSPLSSKSTPKTSLSSPEENKFRPSSFSTQEELGKQTGNDVQPMDQDSENDVSQSCILDDSIFDKETQQLDTSVFSESLRKLSPISSKLSSLKGSRNSGNQASNRADIFNLETQKPAENLYEMETQEPSFNDSSSSKSKKDVSGQSIYSLETQKPETDIYSRETQKVKDDICSKEIKEVDSDLCSAETQQVKEEEHQNGTNKSSENIYDKETQRLNVSIFDKKTHKPESARNLSNLETQTFDGFYNKETQKVSENIFDKETQQVNENICVIKTQRLNDVFSKETQQVNESISGLKTRQLNDVFTKETQQVDKNICDLETQQVNANICDIKTQQLNDVFNKDTQRVNENICDIKTQQLNDVFSKEIQQVDKSICDLETQSLNENIFDRETQQGTKNIFDSKAQRVNKNIFDVETQKPSDDVKGIFDLDTQKTDMSISNIETQIIPESRKKKSIFEEETQEKEAGDLDAGTQKPDDSIHSTETKKIMSPLVEVLSKQAEESEESTCDMITQKLNVPNNEGVKDEEDEDDDMTQIISSTPAVINTARKKSLAALNRNLARDHLGSPIVSDSSQKSLKSKRSKSPNSNNQSSNTSSLYSMELNSVNGAEDIDLEDLGKKVDPKVASIVGNLDGKSPVEGEDINDGDLNDMLTQKLPVSSSKQTRKISNDSKKGRLDLDNMPTQVISENQEASTKKTRSLKKAPHSTSELMEMSTQLINDSSSNSKWNCGDRSRLKRKPASAKEDRDVCDMLTQMVPAEKMSISKQSNYNNSTMDLDEMLTQKIDTIDGVETIRKTEKSRLKQTASTPRVSSKSCLQSSSVDNLDNMLTQKLPSKDVTSHSVLSMDVCQSQPLGVSKNLDVISSGDETDDDIGQFVKPLSSKKPEVEPSLFDKEVEALSKKMEQPCKNTAKSTSVQTRTESPEVPESQSIITDEEISETPSTGSDPVFSDQAASFFRNIPEKSMNDALSTGEPLAKFPTVVEKDSDSKSSGTVTPDDLAFVHDLVAAETKTEMKAELDLNLQAGDEKAVVKEEPILNFVTADTKVNVQTEKNVKLSDKLTPDSQEFNSNSTKKLRGTKATELKAEEGIGSEETVAEKATTSKPLLEDETNVSAEDNSQPKKVGRRSKKPGLSIPENQPSIEKSNNQEITSLTTVDPTDIASEPASPPPSTKTSSRRGSKNASCAKAGDGSTTSEKQDDLPLSRVRSSRTKVTEGKYKAMLKGVQTSEAEEESGNPRSSRRSKRGGQNIVIKADENSRDPEKLSEIPLVDASMKSSQGKISSNEKPKEQGRAKGPLSKLESKSSSIYDFSSDENDPFRELSLLQTQRRSRQISDSTDDELESKKPKTKNIASAVSKDSIPEDNTTTKDINEAEKKKSTRGRRTKISLDVTDEAPKNDISVAKEKESTCGKSRKSQIIDSGSEEENTRSSRAGRSAGLKRKVEGDSHNASQDATPTKKKLSELGTSKKEPCKDPQAEIKTRTPSKRKAFEVKGSFPPASDVSTPKKKLKLNDKIENDSEASSSDAELSKTKTSSTRMSRRQTLQVEKVEDVKEESTRGRRSTRGGKQASQSLAGSQTTKSKAETSRKDTSVGRMSRKAPEIGPEETAAQSETGRKSKVKEVVRLATRSSSQSDTDSVKSTAKESVKKPLDRKSRARLTSQSSSQSDSDSLKSDSKLAKKLIDRKSQVATKRNSVIDASTSETENASPSKTTTPAKSRVSRLAKQEDSVSPRSSTRKISAPIKKYHIMFTGLDEKTLAKFENIVTALGGVLEENPSLCTVLVTDKVRRTIKFLSTLAQGKPIVSIKWLEVSNKLKSFKDPFEYLIQDKQSEQNFDFNLSESLTKALDTPLLAGYSVFVTPSVKPEPSQMKAIIESAGGKFLSKQPALWSENSFIVSSLEDKSHWPKDKGSKFTPKIVSAEIILRGILQQRLDFEAHKLK